MEKLGKIKIKEVHPELRKGEVFLTNTSDDRLPQSLTDGGIDDRSGWGSIGWRTKRRGIVAYDSRGRTIKGMFPVFVSRKELVKRGINPDKL